MENNVKLFVILLLCFGYGHGRQCGYKTCQEDVEFCDHVIEYCIKCEAVCRNGKNNSLRNFCLTICPVYMISQSTITSTTAKASIIDNSTTNADIINHSTSDHAHMTVYLLTAVSAVLTFLMIIFLTVIIFLLCLPRTRHTVL